MRIKLPDYKYFSYGNIYTGSVVPDHTKGCLSQTVFNYKVKIEGYFLYAYCYYTLPWNAVSNIDEVIVARFESNDFGLEVAENWLNSKVFINHVIEDNNKRLTEKVSTTEDNVNKMVIKALQAKQ